MKAIFFSILFLNFTISNAQKNDRPEIGIEGFLSASTQGGSYGLGLKYGVKVNENIIVGPSFRALKSWSNNLTGQKFSYSIYGLGGFLHARYGNALFGGIEYELFRTPVNSFGYVEAQKSFSSTLFVGGGFSREFKSFIRLNAGIFYDVINQLNSPFRPSYMMKKTDPATGKIAGYIPVIYRITFFFPIGKIKDDSNEEEEEN
jgi:hypothetical protein